MCAALQLCGDVEQPWLMSKHDVIRKTGSTQHITTPPAEDRATAIGTHTHPFNGPFSRTTRVSRYQKGKTNLDFTEARDSEWQWHQLSHMQVCTSLQTDNHASTPPLSFLQAGCPSCRPTNSVRELKALVHCINLLYIHIVNCSAVRSTKHEWEYVDPTERQYVVCMVRLEKKMSTR